MILNSIFLIGAVQALFLCFVFISKRNKDYADKVLTLWLLTLAVHLMFIYFGFSGVYKLYPELVIVGASLMFLQGPFLYLYTCAASGQMKIYKMVITAHFLPFLLFTLYFTYQILALPSSERYESITELLNSTTNPIIIIYGLLNHIHIIVYLILSILVLNKHSKSVVQIFSYTEDISLQWLKYLIYAITAIAVFIVIGLIITDIIPIISQYAKATLIYSALAVLPFYMAYYAIRQKIIYPSTSLDETQRKYKASGLKPQESKLWSQKLTAFIKSEKPYLDPKLTIKDLSLKLDVHPKLLSQVINENFNQNFFNYINAFRVEEFKSQIGRPENANYTIMAIAYDCGFNTKSTFNSIFKKHTGVTPTNYKSKL